MEYVQNGIRRTETSSLWRCGRNVQGGRDTEVLTRNKLTRVKISCIQLVWNLLTRYRLFPLIFFFFIFFFFSLLSRKGA